MIINLLLIFIFVIIIHELIHFISAKILACNVKLGFKYCFPYIEYETNNNLYVLIISILPSVILSTIGILIPTSGIYLIFFKFICLLNLIEIFPIAPDGILILESISNIIKDKKK